MSKQVTDATDVIKTRNPVDDLILEIKKLPDAPKKERFPDREGGLLIPNHNIAGLKALVSELEAVKAVLGVIAKTECNGKWGTDHDESKCPAHIACTILGISPRRRPTG